MKRLGVGAMVLFAGIIYFQFNPANSTLFPKCPFLVLTGFKCPGCGSQRVIYSLLHGDIISAFNYNALLVISLPILLLLGYAEYFRIKQTKLYTNLHHPYFICGWLIIIIIWWIFRNVFGF